MNLRKKLSDRIGINDIHEIISLVQSNDKKIRELYNLLFDKEDRIAYQAAWVLTHLSIEGNKWLYNKQDKLIDEVLVCEHIGKRRLILTLLYKQPLTNPLRIDFLDFCLDKMISKQEPPGVQSICMKIAYELCFPIPELKQELQASLEMLEGELLPAIYTSKKNILNAMVKGKSLQVI